jgi:putative membrane protein
MSQQELSMLSRPLTILLVALATAAPTFAADPPSTAAATAPAAPSTDAFLARLVPGNTFEIDSSKLAIATSKSETVKAFATRMVKDHGDAAAKLKQALTEAKLEAPPDALDARHQALYDTLKKKEGVAFDQAYVDAQTTGHVETVALLEAYAREGDNPRLQAFANDVLPTLRAHLDHVKKLHAAAGKR